MTPLSRWANKERWSCVSIYQPSSWREINTAVMQEEPFFKRGPVAVAAAFKEGKCCDLWRPRPRRGVTWIVGDTYGLLADIYFCC